MQGELLISSQTTRSQADNLTDAIGRLQALLEEAADSIKPIKSDPAKVKNLQKRKKKVRPLLILHPNLQSASWHIELLVCFGSSASTARSR